MKFLSLGQLVFYYLQYDIDIVSVLFAVSGQLLAYAAYSAIGTRKCVAMICFAYCSKMNGNSGQRLEISKGFPYHLMMTTDPIRLSHLRDCWTDNKYKSRNSRCKSLQSMYHMPYRKLRYDCFLKVRIHRRLYNIVMYARKAFCVSHQR